MSISLMSLIAEAARKAYIGALRARVFGHIATPPNVRSVGSSLVGRTIISVECPSSSACRTRTYIIIILTIITTTIIIITIIIIIRSPAKYFRAKLKGPSIMAYYPKDYLQDETIFAKLHNMGLWADERWVCMCVCMPVYMDVCMNG
jgi:hypothetical protein